MPLPIGRLDREAGASACKEGYVGPVPGLLFLSVHEEGIKTSGADQMKRV